MNCNIFLLLLSNENNYLFVRNDMDVNKHERHLDIN